MRHLLMLQTVCTEKAPPGGSGQGVALEVFGDVIGSKISKRPTLATATEPWGNCYLEQCETYGD